MEFFIVPLRNRCALVVVVLLNLCLLLHILLWPFLKQEEAIFAGKHFVDEA